MRIRTVLMTALAFVGLVVGAGFATGQEVLQYFISFGAIGIVGAVLSGVVMAVSGTLVVLAVGQLDVDRVSNIISLVTPLIVIAVLVALRHQLRLQEHDAGRLHEPGDRRKPPEHPRSPLGRLLRHTDARCSWCGRAAVCRSCARPDAAIAFAPC